MKFKAAGLILTLASMAATPAVCQVASQAPSPASLSATPNATEVLETIKSRYGAVQSYSVTAKRCVVDAKGIRDPQEALVKIHIAYQAPNKLLLKSPNFMLATNGESILMTIESQQTFVRLEAPEKLSSRTLARRSLFFADAKLYPVVDLLTGAFEMKPARAKSEEIDGRTVVQLLFIDPFPMQIFADAATGQIVRTRYPYTGEADMWLQIDYKDEQLDAQHAPDLFATTTPDQFFDYTEVAKRADPNYYYNHAMEKAGQPAPEFALESLDGNTMQLKNGRGKVIVLDFWATYCPPCIQSIPHVEDAMRQLANEKVELWGMNRDYGANREQLIRDFTQKHGLDNLQLLVESEDLPLQYHADLMPTFVFIDPQGIIRDYITGPIDDPQMLVKRVRPLLQE